MARILQQFDFRQSLYQRPNQEWQCGRTAEGKPCQIGPDAKGRCRATFECQPICDGDRWTCTRSASAGGPCEDGPLPDGTCCRPIARCNPIRSWRARIGLVSRWATYLTVGFLLIVFTGSYRTQFVDPGDLTFQHSRVGSCSGCHSSFELGHLGWPHAAIAGVPEIKDSELCVACHAMGDNALDPHGLPRPVTAGITARAEKPTTGSVPWTVRFTGAVLPTRSESGEVLACMSCHREHRGQTAGLTETSDERCTTCHAAQFSSFSDGHPRFTRYPFKRRTRIAFDHAGHFQTHFQEKDFKDKAPSGCFACHTPDVRGSTMVVKGFEATCADCHAGQIEGDGRATAKGIEVLNVPGLDVASLAEMEVAIGGWPEDAEGEITPFMDFLLSVDAGYGEARQLLADLDLLDLADAEDNQIAAVKTVAWSVKVLLHDLAVDGVPALGARLEKAAGRDLSMSEVAGLAGLLPAAVVREAQRAWFPRLYREIPKHRAGEAVPIPDELAAVAGYETAAGPAATDSDDILGKDETLDKSDSLEDALDKEELLDKSESLEDSLEKEESLDQSESLEDSLDKEESPDQGGSLEGDLAGEDDKKEAQEAEEEEPVELASGEDWAAAGGWYVDEFAVLYRPVGHGDGMIEAWLTHTASGATAGEAASVAIFDLLADPKAPGRCVKCHSVDATDKRGAPKIAVNWTAKRPLLDAQRFTAFSHTAHFPLLDEEGCVSCHIAEAGAKPMNGYKDRDPETFESDFAGISRKTCAECHTETGAADTCTTCHNYHIGRFPPAVASSPKMMAGAKKEE